MSTFYLGTHEPGWLFKPGPPLFVSHRRLARLTNLRRTARRWCLDSGAFTELSMHGKYVTSPAEYAEAVARYSNEVNGMVWAAPQDWMCEPFMLTRTGLTVLDHQWRTIESYLKLRDHAPIIPVLQGWTINDYVAHVHMYAESGVDLARVPVVGLGSVCRRQATAEIGGIARELHSYGLRLHGFGVKTLGLVRYGEYLVSADSMAWSQQARREPPLPGHTHGNCANCITYAHRWRTNLIDRLDQSWSD